MEVARRQHHPGQGAPAGPQVGGQAGLWEWGWAGALPCSCRWACSSTGKTKPLKAFQPGSPAAAAATAAAQGVWGLEPTWRMVPGASRESLALEVARQYQVPEGVLARAAELYSGMQAVTYGTHGQPGGQAVLAPGACDGGGRMPWQAAGFGWRMHALLQAAKSWPQLQSSAWLVKLKVPAACLICRKPVSSACRRCLICARRCNPRQPQVGCCWVRC